MAQAPVVVSDVLNVSCAVNGRTIENARSAENDSGCLWIVEACEALAKLIYM